MTIFVRGLTAAVLVVVCAAPASAQMYELVGNRAQGMAGAFVAIADDATATWWNPAGLATGANLSIVYDRASTTGPVDPPDTGPAWLGKTNGIALTTPVLGLSYYRLRISEIRPGSPNGADDSGRQEDGAAGLDVRTFALSEYGASFGQSLGGNLVVGSTLKLVRVGRAAGLDSGTGSARDRLDAADSADVSSETETDLDIGVMASFAHVRVGASVKHVRQPEIGEGEDAFELKRQARAGMAVFAAGGGPLSAITAAVDADLTTIDTPVGDVRHVATGAEAWLLSRRVGLRGGYSKNTVGDEGSALSVGVSLGSRGGYYVDGFYTVGSDKSREGWGWSLRVSF